MFGTIESLLKEINDAIADGKTTVTESANVDAKFVLFNAASKAFNQAVEGANKAIQDEIKRLAEADAAEKDKHANDAVNDAANVNKITGAEKQALKQYWDEINAEFPQIIEQAAKYNISDNTFKLAYHAVNDYMPIALYTTGAKYFSYTSLFWLKSDSLKYNKFGYINLSTTNNIDGAKLRTIKAKYSEERAKINKIITGIVKDLADNAQGDIDDTKEKLFKTGIDITAERVILTGKTLVRDNDGKQIAMFDNGKLKTELIETEKIVAKQLKTAEQGPRVVIEGSVIDIFGAFARNIRFGVNPEGYATLSYYGNDGTLIYDLGPNGIDWGSIKPESWSDANYFKINSDTSDNPSYGSFNSITRTTENIPNGIGFKYFAGSNPTISPEDKNKEKYIYKSASTTGGYVDDGWYTRGGSFAYTYMPSQEEVNAGSIDKEYWLTMRGNGVFTGSFHLIYMRKIFRILSGLVTTSTYDFIVWNKENMNPIKEETK